MLKYDNRSLSSAICAPTAFMKRLPNLHWSEDQSHRVCLRSKWNGTNAPLLACLSGLWSHLLILQGRLEEGNCFHLQICKVRQQKGTATKNLRDFTICYSCSLIHTAFTFFKPVSSMSLSMASETQPEVQCPFKARVLPPSSISTA